MTVTMLLVNTVSSAERSAISPPQKDAAAVTAADLDGELVASGDQIASNC
jgi:hypothetical protein